jgi:hypothetical protein
MPPVSKAQARAMYAAAEGKSTLGIPKSVGKDFTKDVPKGLPERKASADKAKKLMAKRKGKK